MHGLKSAILDQQIGWIGHALLVQPFKMAHRIFFSKAGPKPQNFRSQAGPKPQNFRERSDLKFCGFGPSGFINFCQQKTCTPIRILCIHSKLT
jgi:hypothetical protein